MTVPKSRSGFLTRTNLRVPASRPIALCLFRSDDMPIDLASNGDVPPRGPVSAAVPGSCRRNADLSRIVIFLRPRPVSENRQTWQRLQELQLWSPENHHWENILRKTFIERITSFSIVLKIIVVRNHRCQKSSFLKIIVVKNHCCLKFVPSGHR